MQVVCRALLPQVCAFLLSHSATDAAKRALQNNRRDEALKLSHCSFQNAFNSLQKPCKRRYLDLGKTPIPLANHLCLRVKLSAFYPDVHQQ